MRKTLTAAALALALLLCCAAASADTDYAATYEAALTLAGQDLTSPENVTAAQTMLQRTGSYLYTRSYAQYFEALGEVLREPPDLNTARLHFEIIGQAEAFEADLARRGLPTCRELAAYTDARILEAFGDVEAAFTAYARLTVLDAPDRAWRLGLRIAQVAPAAQAGATPALTTAASAPVQNGLSSYGHVTLDHVNLRAGATTASAVLRWVERTELALILGRQSDGESEWYRVTVGGTEGYIRGDSFRQMTVAELSEFLSGANAWVTPAAGGASGATWAPVPTPTPTVYATWAPMPTPPAP